MLAPRSWSAPGDSTCHALREGEGLLRGGVAVTRSDPLALKKCATYDSTLEAQLRTTPRAL